MAFQKGDPKPPGSGRKKGQPNRITLLRVEDFLNTKGIHPVQKILDLLPTLDPADQVKTWLHLMKYVEPELRPTEALLNVTPEDTHQTYLEAQTTEQLHEALERADTPSPMGKG